VDDLNTRALRRLREEIRIERLAAIIEALLTQWLRGDLANRVTRPLNAHPLGFTEEQIRGRVQCEEAYHKLFEDSPYLPADIKKALSESDAKSLAVHIALERRVGGALFRLRHQDKVEAVSHRGQLYWFLPSSAQKPPPAEEAASKPDAKGLVQAPSDRRAYLPASKIVSEHTNVVASLKKLNQLLKKNPSIRRWQPTRQRLMVHEGDFRRHIRERGGKPLEDFTADEMSDELERRKPKKRRPSH
jgi:hypothetical protein